MDEGRNRDSNGEEQPQMNAAPRGHPHCRPAEFYRRPVELL
jgi:hypothetical protein